MKSKIMAFRDVHKLFLDAWSLYRRYAVTDLSDIECDQVQEEADQIRKRYDSVLANDILIAVIRELSKLAKMKEKKGEKK